MSGRDPRAAEVAGNLDRIRRRVATACSRAGRAPEEVSIIAVTKSRPVGDVALVAEAGLTDIGENRAGELAEKAESCAESGLTWHFVGQLQTNKAGAVARWADVVHSVDRVRLVRALGQRVRARERRLTALVQVDLDPDSRPGTAGPRGGCDPRDLTEIADAVAGEDGLDLGGVMAVAPPPTTGVDPAAAFARLQTLATELRQRHPGARIVSAGMSGDMEQAVEYGATHLRIGTALLGNRPAVVG